MSGPVDLRHLQYFLALAEEGNFTRAAARVWVTQQAFSKAIAQLEGRVGARLVERRPRGCSLTPAGRRLAMASRSLLAEADRVAEVAVALRTGAGDATPTLRVGSLLDGLGPLTPAVLTGYRAVAPDVTVTVRRIQPHEIPGAVLSGEIDVALVHGPCDHPAVHAEAVFDEPRWVALSAADRRADADALTAADLLTVPARTRRPGVDPDWEAAFTLRDERNGEDAPRLGEPARSLEDLLWSISLEELFLTIPEHLTRTYGRESFGVAYVPVPDLPPVTFSVLRRRDDTRAAVLAFVATASAVTAARRRPQPEVVGPD